MRQNTKEKLQPRGDAFQQAGFRGAAGGAEPRKQAGIKPHKNSLTCKIVRAIMPLSAMRENNAPLTRVPREKGRPKAGSRPEGAGEIRSGAAAVNREK